MPKTYQIHKFTLQLPLGGLQYYVRLYISATKASVIGSGQSFGEAYREAMMMLMHG
jgi:hypothetical protein